jgi:hypothetical protein
MPGCVWKAIITAARKHQEEIKTMPMTAAQAFEEQGRIEERETIILRQLQKRFGTVPATLRDRIHRLAPVQLSDLVIEMVDFNDLEEARKWVLAHS